MDRGCGDSEEALEISYGGEPLEPVRARRERGGGTFSPAGPGIGVFDDERAVAHDRLDPRPLVRRRDPGTQVSARIPGARLIGNFDDSADLAGGARYGRRFLAASARRTRPDLDDLTAADVYDIRCGQYIVAIRGPDTRKLKAPRGAVWDRDPYLLEEVGGSSLRDKYAVVAARRADGYDRLIVKAFKTDAVTEVLLAPGECDAAVASYCDWVESLRA